MLRGTRGSALEVINNISQALFNLDTVIKDRRLSFPIGNEVSIRGSGKTCQTELCPLYREHPYAEMGFDALEISLQSFRDLFTGTAFVSGRKGFGIDDLLKNRDQASLSNEMLAGIDNTLKNLRALKEKTTLKEALSNIDKEKCEQTRSDNRLVEICALVWDIRKTTDKLKNEYINALSGLSAPRTSTRRQ